MALYDKYGDHILGVISGVRFPVAGEKDPDAGIRFADHVREKCPYMPIIIESQESENKEKAESRGYVFLDKNSKTLPQDLRNAVGRHFGFGDFIVTDPST